MLACLAALLVVVWSARGYGELQGALRDARMRAKSLGASAQQRQLEARRIRAIPGIPEAIPRFQAEMASAGRAESPGAAAVQDGHADVRAADESQVVREQGEARLRAEQARFTALTAGNPAQSWQPVAPGAPQVGQARCASTKLARDAAYARMGNRRSFDFIRAWDDRVHAACGGN